MKYSTLLVVKICCWGDWQCAKFENHLEGDKWDLKKMSHLMNIAFIKIVVLKNRFIIGIGKNGLAETRNRKFIYRLSIDCNLFQRQNNDQKIWINCKINCTYYGNSVFIPIFKEEIPKLYSTDNEFQQMKASSYTSKSSHSKNWQKKMESSVYRLIIIKQCAQMIHSWIAVLVHY